MNKLKKNGKKQIRKTDKNGKPENSKQNITQAKYNSSRRSGKTEKERKKNRKNQKEKLIKSAEKIFRKTEESEKLDNRQTTPGNLKRFPFAFHEIFMILLKTLPVFCDTVSLQAVSEDSRCDVIL